MSAPSDPLSLFRLLGDPGRVRLLALCAEEELSMSELGTLLRESQSQLSRRATALRNAGLVEERREGTRVYLRTLDESGQDPVVRAALQEGQRLCRTDGTLAKVQDLLAARADESALFFASSTPTAASTPAECRSDAVHLAALGPLLSAQRLAVDVGCGDGSALLALAPLFRRVVAVDQSPAQLAVAASRVRAHGLSQVSFHQGAPDDPALLERVDGLGGADLVFASRVLHHAARPAAFVAAAARLLAPQGSLVLVDYCPHNDESLRDQGDIWLGFEPARVEPLLAAAGLVVTHRGTIPPVFHPPGKDAPLDWFHLVARRDDDQKRGIPAHTPAQAG